MLQLQAFIIGEPGGIRTHDPMIKSHVLYRLSYGLTLSHQQLRQFIRSITVPSGNSARPRQGGSNSMMGDDGKSGLKRGGRGALAGCPNTLTWSHFRTENRSPLFLKML
jgi:hypothetical protein